MALMLQLFDISCISHKGSCEYMPETGLKSSNERAIHIESLEQFRGSFPKGQGRKALDGDQPIKNHSNDSQQ
jgi:hypothetical protein